MQRHTRIFRALPLLSLLTLAVAAIGLTSASAQVQPRRAGLVAHFPDGGNLVKCVQFAEESLTGEELLLRSGWDVLIDASYGLGGAVCSINGNGCPVDDCFCECRGGGQCEYWAYWHLQGNEWEYSQTGGGAYTVADGAVDGWSWGPGNFQTGTEPPSYTFDQICNPTSSSGPPPSSNTPAPASKAPEGTLEVEKSSLRAKECTVLRWTVFDAVQVTLDGEQVMAQDRKEVCPSSTQRFTLVATNAVGRITREVIVRVEGATAPTSTATQLAPQGAPDQPPTETPPQPDAPAPPQPAPLPAPPEPQAPIAIETAPVATVAILPQPVSLTPSAGATGAPAELSSLAVALTALPTPVLVAEILQPASARSRPTPTPILLAMAFDVEAAAAASEGAQPSTARFDAGLLPGYAAFLLIAALLMGAAAWVWQRRRTP